MESPFSGARYHVALFHRASESGTATAAWRGSTATVTTADADTATACPPILMDTRVSTKSGTRVQSEGHKTSGTKIHPQKTPNQDPAEDETNGGTIDLTTPQR